jgi:hypothetical protein
MSVTLLQPREYIILTAAQTMIAVVSLLDSSLVHKAITMRHLDSEYRMFFKGEACSKD